MARGCHGNATAGGGREHELCVCIDERKVRQLITSVILQFSIQPHLTHLSTYR